MDFALKMMDFALKMMDFVFKMMILMGTARAAPAAGKQYQD